MRGALGQVGVVKLVPQRGEQPSGPGEAIRGA